MPRTSEQPIEGREKENKPEQEQQLPPDFNTRYGEIEDAIEKGSVSFSPFADDPEFYFLIARGGALFQRAVARGLIELTATDIDKLISRASKETVLGSAIKSALFPISKGNHRRQPIIPKDRIIEHFKKMRQTARGPFLDEFSGNLSRELKDIVPPTQEDFAFLREHNPQILVNIMNGPCRDDFFDLAFPPAQDSRASAEAMEFMSKEANFREMLDSAAGEQFMDRAFPDHRGMNEWITQYPHTFFQLLARPAGQRFLRVAESDHESRNNIQHVLREETKKSPGLFLKNLGSPAGTFLWDAVNPQPDDVRTWMKSDSSSFVQALNEALGKQIIERANLSANDIRQWKDGYADSFIQSLKSPFGDSFFKVAFEASTREENLQWINKNLYLYIRYGLMGPKAKEFFELVNPTQEEVRQWYKRDEPNFTYMLQSPVGERLFSLLAAGEQQKIINNQSDAKSNLILALKLNKEVADPDGLFRPVQEAEQELEREPRIPLPAGERTAGIEIEPFNNERSELRTHAFSATKKKEMLDYFSAFTRASEQWALREHEQYGYSNTHLNIGIFKKDLDTINGHRQLFLHQLPEAYLYAYFPVERISYRGIQKDLHTTLDTDEVERTLNPEVIARLQYRIACVGGPDATERIHQTDGIERLLNATLDILDSPEATEHYTSLLNDQKTKDVILEIHWLIKERYMPTQQRAIEVHEQLQALKRLVAGLGNMPSSDEIKKEKIRIVREIKAVQQALDHWPRIIKERQEILRAMLDPTRNSELV